MTKYIQLSEPPKQIRKPRVNQFLPYLNQITQWCQEGKTAIWIHKQLIQQGFKGAPSSTRRKVQEIKATLSIKKVTIQPPSKRIPFLGVFVNDM